MSPSNVEIDFLPVLVETIADFYTQMTRTRSFLYVLISVPSHNQVARPGPSDHSMRARSGELLDHDVYAQ